MSPQWPHGRDHTGIVFYNKNNFIIWHWCTKTNNLFSLDTHNLTHVTHPMTKDKKSIVKEETNITNLQWRYKATDEHPQYKQHLRWHQRAAYRPSVDCRCSVPVAEYWDSARCPALGGSSIRAMERPGNPEPSIPAHIGSTFPVPVWDEPLLLVWRHSLCWLSGLCFYPRLCVWDRFFFLGLEWNLRLVSVKIWVWVWVCRWEGGGLERV